MRLLVTAHFMLYIHFLFNLVHAFFLLYIPHYHLGNMLFLISLTSANISQAHFSVVDFLDNSLDCIIWNCLDNCIIYSSFDVRVQIRCYLAWGYYSWRQCRDKAFGLWRCWFRWQLLSPFRLNLNFNWLVVKTDDSLIFFGWKNYFRTVDFSRWR